LKLRSILYQSILLLLLFFLAEISQAQLCTGTIGEPAVTIDFGANMPRSTSLSQVPVPYQFVNSPCPERGSYSVINSTFQCFNRLWSVLPFDHTPHDVSGNFLLVNALTGPSIFYIDTIRGLCSGHTFQVGAWIANLVSPKSCTGPGTAPNLTFSIYSLAGVLLGTYTSGEITASLPAEWVSRKFQFDLPSGSSDVILKITDITGFGCGNAFAIDDITFSPCGGNLSIAFPGTSAQEIYVCEEKQSNYLLIAFYPGFTNPVVQWQVSYDGETFFDIAGKVSATFFRAPTVPGIYTYRF
jgi:hypothetical protein